MFYCNKLHNSNVSNKYSEGDIVKIVNVKDEVYIDKLCIVKKFDNVKNRYTIYCDELKKYLSLREQNLLSAESEIVFLNEEENILNEEVNILNEKRNVLNEEENI